MRTSFLSVLGALAALASTVHASTIKIVAAENFYGSVAKQVAGSSASVTSILTNPNQDPHEFISNAKTAKSIADADVVIYSGIDYDPWVNKLLATRGNANRVVIHVSQLIEAKEGDNPHIWYNPKTMPALVDRLVAVLSQIDSVDAASFSAKASSFKDSMKPELDKIAAIRSMANGASVTATEPVFGYMADALGLKMLNYPFQVKVMNDSEPSASETSDFEKSLRSHDATILFYNSQVTDPTTARIQKIAKESGVPIVGVTETQPPDQKSYVAWMMHQLDGVEAALHQKNG
jgi:zinc/manganese transport system substrate-binding protein